MKYCKITCNWVARVFADGKVEVEQAQSDSIEGRVYFTCSTKAYKQTKLMLDKGLISAKRSNGWYVTPKGFVQSRAGYFLGAVILSERNTSGHEYAAECARSGWIKESGYV